MFKFDKSKFRTEFVGLKSISKSTIDPRVNYTREGGEVVKQPIPVAIARNIKNRLKGTTKFTVDYPACIAFIGDRIISMDVPVGADYKTYQDLGEWFSIIEKKVGILEKLDDTWQWDGQYVYKAAGEVQRLGETNFGSVPMRVFNLFKLGEDKADVIENLAGLAYFNQLTGTWTTTSPMTRHSGGFLQLTGDVDTFNRTDAFVEGASELNRLNKLMFPNLRFVNYASKVLSDRFGYDAIEPLGLPLLMIEHRTFNLGGLSTAVQTSSPAPFSFTEGLAWMVGMYNKVTDLDDLNAVKSTLKMLLTKGNTLAVVQGEIGNTDEQTDTKEVIESVRKRLADVPLISFD